MATLLRFWIVLTIYHVVDKTMAQQCPSERSISGWMLQLHVYKTMLADIGLHCWLVCRTDDRCQSFNFVMSSHMCEFNDRTKEATPEDFIPDPDRYYFGKRVNRVPLGSIPELAVESCKEIKMSEEETTSRKYWLSSIKPGIPLFAFCNMTTEDVNECTASLPVCHVSAQCHNTLGSYRCICDPGYTYNGKRCTDVNECTASPSPCHMNAQCTNTIGSYCCACNPGYTGNGKTCTDVNECTASPSPCQVNAQCTNTIGSYRCTCKPGYTGNGKTCTDVNECTASPSPCHINAQCTNTIGSYCCACNPGYTGNGKTCTDVNECTASPSACQVNAQCTNTIGSYRCTCRPGYTGNGKTCSDINECTASLSACHVNAHCSNTVGSYRCTCNPGYTGNGKTCTDICPANFVVHGNSCYYTGSTSASTWQNSRSKCQNMGADLFVIKSSVENQFVSSLTSGGRGWIGLRRKADKSFYWLDDRPAQGNYQNWANGEPNDSEGIEDCAEILGDDNGKWNDLSCSETKTTLLCQKSF